MLHGLLLVLEPEAPPWVMRAAWHATAASAAASWKPAAPFPGLPPPARPPHLLLPHPASAAASCPASSAFRWRRLAALASPGGV